MQTDVTNKLIKLRRNHSAWLLLASRNGPLILGGLKSLIDAHPGGIDFENAVEHLASLFADNANDSKFDTGDDHVLAARRELRGWVKRGLLVERDGEILATDALQRAFHFIESLEDQPMTSTASRLATVQRAIENLEAQLSHSRRERMESLRRRIRLLEDELVAVESGDFKVLSGSQAEEGIREVYQLAMSLRADFRRVEDSYREADRELRHRIISEKQNRGEIVDELLDGHDELVRTVEGQVFESFYQQLVQTAELDEMKRRLRAILENESTDSALERKQKANLRTLVSRLVQESDRVIQARARSERDVRGFLKSGLADEQIRVGAILQDLFQVALAIDWNSQKVRRTPGPLPPTGVSAPNRPLVERLLAKQFGNDTAAELDLTVQEADLEEMDEEFWQAYRALDRQALFESTIAHLRKSDEPLTIGALAKALPPTHDLETLAYWLAMARETGIDLGDSDEAIELFDENDGWARFFAPKAELTFAAVRSLEPGNLE